MVQIRKYKSMKQNMQFKICLTITVDCRDGYQFERRELKAVQVWPQGWECEGVAIYGKIVAIYHNATSTKMQFINSVTNSDVQLAGVVESLQIVHLYYIDITTEELRRWEG